MEKEGKYKSSLRNTYGRRRESTEVVCETHGSRRESTKVVCQYFDTHENILLYIQYYWRACTCRRAIRRKRFYRWREMRGASVSDASSHSFYMHHLQYAERDIAAAIGEAMNDDGGHVPPSCSRASMEQSRAVPGSSKSSLTEFSKLLRDVLKLLRIFFPK